MPAPIDYILDVKDPLESALRGYSAGSAIGQQNLARQQAQVQRQQAAQMQSDMLSLSTKPDATIQDYREFKIRYPSMPEHFSKVLDSMTEEQKTAKQNQAIQVFSALSTGNTDTAKDILTEQKAAAENYGDTKSAEGAKAMLRMLEINPEAAKTSTGLMLSISMGDEKFSEALEKLQSESRAAALAPVKKRQETAKLEAAAEELNLTKAKTSKVLAETRKLGFESRKAALELEQLKESGGVTPEKKFDQETKLRGEYVNRTKNFSEVQDAFSKINESAADASGAGDIALITSFMKMLDPGSVVRETEFATAQDTAGLFAKLQNAAEKAQTGQFLTPKQRNEFTRLANRYMDATKRQEKDIRDGLNKVVKNYSLNPDNVFGVVEFEEETVAAPPTEGKSYMKYAGTR